MAKPGYELWSETALEIVSSRYFRNSEKSVEELVHRVVNGIQKAGIDQSYFNDSGSKVFASDLKNILLNQVAAFNSPVYFNMGLFERPQTSACFIQDVEDDLLSIFDLLKSEAKLFKYGSGTGTNFSRLRGKGEKLEAGGESSGLISYLEIFDKAAQAIRSGGISRRAAKMVVLDADHPEVFEFIRWKMLEERKARVLLANGFSGGMDGEAFKTVSGQNSNNSIRATNDFLNRVKSGQNWNLTERVSGQVSKTVSAREIMREMARAAWECADPGIQYHDNIQSWHMIPKAGPIRASNPCSEFLFLDNSACNLASLNLVKFLRDDGFDWKYFEHVVKTMLTAQDILVDHSSYPTAKISENSQSYRPLGLGFANLGGLIMRMGVPYQSEEAVQITRKVTASMHLFALQASLQLACKRGPFLDWHKHRDDAIKVIEQHAQSWGKNDELGHGYRQTIAEINKVGLRNAQVTLLAPTGTIGLMMDCDTLGIEPDFALVKRKSLSEGREIILLNRALEPSLRRLAYSDGMIREILAHVQKMGSVIGAPGLKTEHYPIFDCAIAPKQAPERIIGVEGHLNIMAAAQPFLSGGISKTVNLPVSTTIDEIEKLFLRGSELGLKALAVYRDGSKTLQPLCAEC